MSRIDDSIVCHLYMTMTVRVCVCVCVCVEYIHMEYVIGYVHAYLIMSCA